MLRFAASAATLASALASAPASAAAAPLSAPAETFTLHLLDAAAYPMATCLDGTTGGFYFQPGSGSGATQWVVHTQGGGWCVSDEDCLGRAGTPLGSSSAWSTGTISCPSDSKAPVCYADGGAAGMFSSDPAVNPVAFNFNKVFLNYCDGGSYAGSVVAPVPVSGKSVYYRGRFILDAVYATLAAQFGLGAATRLVVKGCSAGGLAVYLHADYVASLVRAVAPAAVVLAAPGAGLFLDVAGIDGQFHYRANYEWVFTAMNASGSVNAACIAATPQADAARCFNAAYTLPFIVTPLFVANSLADSWQAGNIMHLPCNPGSCSGAQEAAVEAYLATFRAAMISALAPVVGSKRHGGFLQSCFVHVVEDVDGSFDSVLVNNATQTSTFQAWIAQTGSDLRMQIDGFWGSNPSCGKGQ
jgi:hypothetical protein